MGAMFGSSCSAANGPEFAAKLPTLAAQADPDTGTKDQIRHLVVAGGCFWCVEGVFEQLKGVTAVESGYAGGAAQTATYEEVSAGATKHAEVVRISYQPDVITFGQLLRVFFATHDPTQLNRQGPDRGPQYRSAVFVENEAQRTAAQTYITQLNDSKVYPDPVVTTIENLAAFYPAEDYHQDFIQHNPNHPYIQVHAVPKIEKVKKIFPDQVKNP